jgi:hypothetical protein
VVWCSVHTISPYNSGGRMHCSSCWGRQDTVSFGVASFLLGTCHPEIAVLYVHVCTSMDSKQLCQHSVNLYNLYRLLFLYFNLVEPIVPLANYILFVFMLSKVFIEYKMCFFFVFIIFKNIYIEKQSMVTTNV